MKGEAVFIDHIIEAVGKINRYINGLEKNDLERDDKTLDAVVRELIIIGEAAANISDKMKRLVCAIALSMNIGRLTLMWFGKPAKTICPH